MNIEADLGKCQGFANCVMAAPEVFDLDDASLVVLARRQVLPDELEDVREAVRSCPVEAIWLTES
ncbi:ferredoxin [Nocardioides carbamazepini]|uniref:ferredoxin n=1 Tax=Nocardioides carbamazepini TaxID=2854259 RepID=UPI00214A706A|nr:ferredoxin [Nocardioides carbamazepini]MCR1786096.1 ferredoxin [Nocardioides carbamazepini]